MIKTVGIAVFSAVSALVFGLLFKNFLSAGNLASLLLLALGMAVFSAIFLIQSLLLNNFSVNLGIASVDGILITAVFWNSLSILMVLAGVGIIGTLIAAYYGAQLELKNNLDIRFFKIGNNLLRYVSSALAIFAIIAYLSLLNLKDPVAAKKALSAVIKPAEPIAAAYIPGFTVDNSLIEVARKLMPADVRASSQAAQNDFIQNSSQRLSDVIGGFTKTAVRTTDSVSDIFYKATVVKFLKFAPLVQKLVLIGAGLFTFFLVKFFLIFVNWAAILLAFGIYQLLWGSGFFKIELESKTKKVIVLEE